MTRDEFVAKAVAAGLGDDDIRMAMADRRKSIGAFDDDAAPSAPRSGQPVGEQPQRRPLAAVWHGGNDYVERVQGAADEAAMDARRSVERDPGAYNRVAAPVRAFTRTTVAQLNESLPYKVAGKVVGGVGGLYGKAYSAAARAVGDVAGEAVDAYQNAPEWLKNADPVVGPVVVPALKQVRKLGKIGDVIRSAAENYERLPEPVKNTLGAIGDVSQVVPGLPAVGKAGKVVAKSAGKTTGKAARSVARGVDDFVGEMAENSSWVPEETLRMAGTKEGRDMLKMYKGKEWEIGQKFVDAVFNPIDKLPEAKKIAEILPKLPPSRPDGIIKAILVRKDGKPRIYENPSEKFKKINEKILGDVKWINGIAIEKGGVLSVEDLMDIREQLDEMLKNSWGKESDYYIETLKAARHGVRQSLIDSAKRSGNNEYVSAMESLSHKLQTIDKVMDRLGSDVVTGMNRGESVIRNLMNKGKTQFRLIVNDFDEAFGTNVLNEAQAAHLADQLTKKGNLPILSKSMTGQGGSFIRRVTLGSPWVASKILKATGRMAGRKPETGKIIVGRVRTGTQYQNLPPTYSAVGGIKPRETIGDAIDPSDPFYRNTVSPQQWEEMKKAREFNDRARPEVEHVDYKPDELKTEHEYGMDRANEAGYQAPAVRTGNFEKEANAEKLRIKNDLGFSRARDIKYDKLTRKERDKIEALAHAINNDPTLWDDLFDRGLLGAKHSDYSVSATERVHADDIVQWMNEAEPKRRRRRSLGTIGDALKDDGGK